MNNNDYLGTEPLGKLLLRLSLPTIVAQIINLLYNMVDRIYIGHMPEHGALALTGVGVCMSIIMIVSAFAALIANGSAPRASMAMGRGDREEAERILGNSFTTLLIISALLTAIQLLFNRPLLLLFGASENTIGYACDYMNLYAIGTVFVQLTLGMNAFITAQGFATTGMLSVLIGAVCNIILDPVFIYAMNMGVRGAALATIISQAVSMVWVLHFLRGRKTILRLKREYFSLHAKTILPCLTLGLAGFIMQASESVIIICFNSSLKMYGGDLAVGAMTILSSVMQFSMLPLMGLAQGSQPIVSYNYGAGKTDRVKKSFFLLLAYSLSYSMLMWLLVILSPALFARIFTPNEELIRYSDRALRIYAGVMGIFGAQIACQITFTSIGRAKESIAVAVMRKFVLLIPLIYILPHLVEEKPIGVYMAEPIADFLAVCFTCILFFFTFRKVLREMRAKEEKNPA